VAPLASALHAAGWRLRRTVSPEEAIPGLREQPAVVGLVDLPERRTALADIGRLLSTRREMAWIALIHPKVKGRLPHARFITRHFFDYHTLPAEPSRLLFSLGHAHGMASLAGEQNGAGTEGEEMVGASPAMGHLLNLLRKVAATDAPVTIRGEQGSGKGVAARAIHNHSARCGTPFIPLQCGALIHRPDAAALFQRVQEALSGAPAESTAAGATLFLDGVEALPPIVQNSLLHLLQSGSLVRPDGGEVRVDLRIVAATSVDLAQCVVEGRFSAPLHHRLDVMSVALPPLREREGDAERLARRFLRRYSRDTATPAEGFSPHALEAIAQHDWPGNVRELMNRVQRAVATAEGPQITPADLGLSRRPRPPRLLTLERARSQAEQQAIADSLQLSRNNVTRAAHTLGVSRVTLYRLMEKHGIAH